MAQDPSRGADRVARQWAVLAVATLWAVEIGGEGEPPEVPAVPAAPRKLSVLRVGLPRPFAALVAREPLPQGQLSHSDWPEREWRSDPLTEDMMNSC